MPAHSPTPPDPFRVEGHLPPRRIPVTYRITLALSAFAMVLLPLLYVALIVAAGFGLKYYAIHGTAIFQVRGGGGLSLWLLALYLAPLIAGAIMLVFMIKPLFAPAVRRSDAFTLDLAQEPQLRDLIAAICTRVGAPMPVQVDVDCQVNASARLRRGLLSLGRQDLVLTIGLPLAGNLTARQFAGVLAHEFGHFTQGAGMAFSYLIGSVNRWFARVVFERDEWDESLARASEDTDARLAIILFTARAAVWFSRKILHGLMLIGHAITCLQLRQMEFDADYYSAHIAGSTAFNDTSAELRRLNAAGQIAFNELGQLWHNRQLVDDFPSFVSLRRTQLAPDLVQKIDAATLGEKTGWLDTHPRDIDRGIQVRALRLPGLFHGEGPATALFTDFAALSRTATLHFYREQLDLTFGAESLVPTTAAAHSHTEAADDESARLKLLGPVPYPARPLLWAETDFTPLAPGTTPSAVAAELAALRQRLAALRPAAETAAQLFKTLHDDLAKTAAAHAFLTARIDVAPDAFGLGLGNLTQTERRTADLTARLAAKRDELAPFESAFHAWFSLAVRAARAPAFAAHLPADLAPRLHGTAQALTQLAPWFRALPDWIAEQSLLSVLSANERHLDTNLRFRPFVSAQRDKTRAIVVNAPGQICGAPWPFRAPGAPATITEHLERSLRDVHGDGRIAVLLQVAVDLHFRLLGQAAKLGLEVEQALNPKADETPASQ